MSEEKPDYETRQCVVRQAAAEPQMDADARTIRSVILTDRVARDGGIVLPDGMDIAAYMRNPIVRENHTGPVVGRCLDLNVMAHEVEAVTQFADNEKGRDYAYLYGLNPENEVFMRAWSARATVLEQQTWGYSKVMALLGTEFEPEELPPRQRQQRSVWVAVRSVLREYSVVPLGADRLALSRAFDDGCETAGDVIARIDLADAQTEISLLRCSQEQLQRQLNTLEEQMQALRRDGAAAAKRGDSAALLAEVRSLRVANTQKG